MRGPEEVIAQILDTVASLLVTPEFLGQHTLESITDNLIKFGKFLFRLWGVLARLVDF